MRRAVVVVFTLALSPAIGAQAPSPQSAPERPRFEAASVKPNTSPDGGIRNEFSPGRFTCLNTRLDSLISIAYRINPDRVLGVPDWARTAKYDIAATHSPEYREFSLQQLLMLQRLLEERFALQSTPRNGLPLQRPPASIASRSSPRCRNSLVSDCNQRAPRSTYSSSTGSSVPQVTEA
jgi:hypothetical protein